MSTRKNFFQRLTAMTIAATGLVIASSASGQILVDQSQLSTGSPAENGTAAPAGTTWSELQHDVGNTTQSNTSLGFSANLDSSGTGVPTGGFRIADNFTVPPGQIWNITGVSVFGYQTGASQTVTPFDALRFQIWRGSPANLASTVVFGDLTTNRLSGSPDALMLRTGGTVVPAPAAPGTTRRIWRINGNAVTALGPGTYWLDYQVSATNNGATFLPPRTIVGTRTQPGWNAIQWAGVQAAPGWFALIDGGNPATAPDVAMDMPFIIQGTQGNGCSTALKPCAADIAPAGGNGTVNTEDLLAVIGTWGSPQVPPGAGPRQLGDVAPAPNGDCTVNTVDLLAVVAAWGNCPTPTGSCCLGNGTCQVLTQAACEATGANSVYNGDFTACGSFCPVRPANDLCANASTAVAGANPFSNLNALTDGPAGAVGNACEVNMARDVWFNYTATQTGGVEFNTVGSTGVTDTLISVYDTQGCPVTTLLGCNDDIDGASTPPNRLSRIIVNLTSGQQVKVRVGQFPNTASGSGVLNITFIGNEICVAAQPLAIPSVTSDVLSGTEQDTAPACNSVNASFGVWYSVVGNGNTLTADTCATSKSSLFETSITVYCGSNCSDLNCVTGDTGGCGSFDLHASVTWCSAVGQTYWILVHTATAPTAPDDDFTLTISNGGPCANPVLCTCFTCQAGSQIEGEACQTAVPDTTNGGCNSTPAVFSTLNWVGNSARVCGIGSTYINGTTQQRDTDWYVFTVTAAGTYTVAVDRARFTCLAGIVTNTALNITACGAGQAFVTNSTVTTTGVACNGATLAAPVTLQPGTYALFVGPSVFTGFPCGSGFNDYQVTLTRSNP